MKVALRENQDVWSGLMMIAIGGATLFIARDYQFGTSLRMGPGYFPTLLGAALVVFGLLFVVRGIRSSDTIEPGWSLRALILVPLSLVLFGVLMTYAGFVPALMALIIGSAAAGTEFKLWEVLALAVGLTAACVVVFIWGLNLPYPLLSGY